MNKALASFRLRLLRVTGSLKTNPPNKKPFGLSPNGFIFQAA
ncbi:hypothetical protein [Kingella oralis]